MYYLFFTLTVGTVQTYTWHITFCAMLVESRWRWKKICWQIPDDSRWCEIPSFDHKLYY